MKVYVSAAYKEAHNAKIAIEAVKASEHFITYDWTNEAIGDKTVEETAEYIRQCAAHCKAGVTDCDAILILANKNGRGMFSELGMALALDKLIVVVKPCVGDNIFFFLPECHKVDSLPDAINLINLTQEALQGKDILYGHAKAKRHGNLPQE